MAYRNFIGFALVFCVLLLISLGCKKDQPIAPIDTLPPLTTEGKNTFGCLVNGKPFISNYKGSSMNVVPAFYYDTKRFVIDATMIDENDILSQTGFIFHLTHNTGEYQMYGIATDSRSYTLYDPNVECNVYYNDIENLGTVNVTFLDTIKRIISGTFQMDLINNDCTVPVLKVSDGRFDVRF
jgi:hypothetical protein